MGDKLTSEKDQQSSGDTFQMLMDTGFVLSIALGIGGMLYAVVIFVLRRTYFRGVESELGHDAWVVATDCGHNLAVESLTATVLVFISVVAAALTMLVSRRRIRAR